jgi:YidC/Oxa1 family membrane protein insertase
MDRTSQIGVFVCAILLFVLYFSSPPPAPRPHAAAATHPAASMATATADSSASQAVNTSLTATPSVPLVEKLTLVENPAIRITFTSAGAAIKEVELKQQRQGTSGNVVLNEQSHENVMAVTGWPGAETADFLATEIPGGVAYGTTLPNGVKWERTYTLGKEYTVEVKDSLTNPSATDVILPAYAVSIGRAQPLRVGGHYQPISNMYLGAGWFTNQFRLTTVSDFNPGYIPIVEIKRYDGKTAFSTATIDPSPLKWLGVENQFFAVLLTPSGGQQIQHAVFQCFNKRDEYGSVPQAEEPDIEASALFPAVKVPAAQSVTLSYGIYAGPKEYDRLSALGDQQQELMNYGHFEPLIVCMLYVLHTFYAYIGSYGVAIILLTLLIKVITWPLQSFANRSGKRMQALAPKLKELQAKYKDQPEKLNTETFAMYKEYSVNPFGGCLPALIQMPVFFSLYFMLQNAVELRGQSFLWVHDLTQPDTVASMTLPMALPLIGNHLTLNPLPLMVTGLTMVMMRMTPQIGDPQQAKIAQWMPLIFLFIFYNFAAGLSLYYVVNNCVSILQIYRNLRKPLPELKRVQRKKT